MPIELRKIIFDTHELKEAIVSYNRVKKDKMPAGDVHVAEVAGDGEVRVKLEITNSSGTVHELELNATDLAAALLVYCKAHQIPIPRAFDKTLSSRDGKLVFELKSYRAAKPSAASGPAHRTAAA